MAIFLSGSARASSRRVGFGAALLMGLVMTASVAAQPAAPAAATGEGAAAASAAASAASTAEAASAAAPAAATGDGAAAAPAAATGDGAAAAPAAATDAPATAAGTPLALKHSCMAAINADQEWTDELRAAVQKRMTYDAHNAEATLIATNKRHVVMAYAALWLAAIGFLVMQWRKQKVLRDQLEALRRDLDTAVKGSK